MSDTPASPPTSGREQHARSTKFPINVPPLPERTHGGRHVPGGQDELQKRLDMVVREQERLRYRLSDELRQSQRQQAERVESYSRQVVELNEQLAQARDEQNRLRDQLAEQVRFNHELERKQIADVAEKERLRERLAAFGEDQERVRVALAERERVGVEQLAAIREENERLRAELADQERLGVEQLAAIGEENERLRAELADQERLGVERLTAVGEENERVRAEMVEQERLGFVRMAAAAEENERLRAELTAQAQENHEIERKSIEERAELERMNFDRLAVAAEERQRIRALLDEQIRETAALRLVYALETERLAVLSKERDELQLKVVTTEREAFDARSALAVAEPEVARLSAIASDRHERLRKLEEALENCARHRAALEMSARELARRNEIECEAMQTAPARAKAGLLDGYFTGRSLKLARKAMERQDWAAAEPLLSMAAPSVDTASVWVQLGHARRELELYSGAASAYARAAEMAPHNGEIFVWLGICQERNGDAGSALGAYRRALEQLPALALRYAELNHLERLDGR